MRTLLLLTLFGTLSYALSISDVVVTPSDSISPAGNKVWTGLVSYTIDESAWVWLELSTDNGTTYTQSLIHAVGDVGMVQAGVKSARWLVDGDQGSTCRIRVRANNSPFTYSLKDADSNKFPFPAPTGVYDLVERLTALEDNHTFSNYSLPPADFNTHQSVNAQFKAGFAKLPAVQNWSNPASDLYYVASYFEGCNTNDRFLVLFLDLEDLRTDEVMRWRDSITTWTSIPAKQIYIGWSHTHMISDRMLNNPVMLRAVIDSAIANTEEVTCAFAEYEMPVGIVHNREALSAATGNSLYTIFNLSGNAGYGGVDWLLDGSDTTGCYVLNGTAGSVQQKRFDGPQDGRLQFISFKNLQGKHTGLFMKMTGHNVYTTKYMDSLSYWLGGTIGRESGYNKIMGGPIVSRFIGFGGNHFEVLRDYPVSGQNATQAERVCKVLRKVITDSFPTLHYSPLTSMGAAESRGLYGCAHSSDSSRVGLDYKGTSLLTLCFNDIYLTSAPGEAPSQQGLYIRGRLQGKKVFYNGYANGWYMYYRWGRNVDYGGYGGNETTKEGSFQMAQDIVRSVKILERNENR